MKWTDDTKKTVDMEDGRFVPADMENKDFGDLENPQSVLGRVAAGEKIKEPG